ncbi:MAG: ribbon-helix-helix domain-containing protein [Alphaproteobacteria bacterium]|nr:ribbon-helix-helix domain-containing protein [Alphaproteobacteria bacterium]
MLRKRSIRLNGHRTSLSLEPEFWSALHALAATEGRTVSALVAEIDRTRAGNLSSAIRVHLLKALSAYRGPT